MIKKTLPIFLLLIVCFSAAKADFNFDSTCVKAYRAILSLKLNEGRALIEKEKQQDPKNGIIILLENYADYFSILASENKDDYARLKDNRSSRIDALEGNDSRSPWYLYSQAQVYLQWSFLKAKFGDYVSSAFDAKKARGLLNDNEQKFHGFTPDQVSLALINVIFGSIPANFQGITRFMGMTGNVQAGVKRLEQLEDELTRSKLSFYNNEVIFFIVTSDINALHNQNDYQKLQDYLAVMDNGSLLKVYLQGWVASKTAHNDDVISFLEAAPKSGEYAKVPAVDYMLGCARMNKLDPSNPAALFDYVKEFKGTAFIKDAYLKIAYYFLLQGDEARYEAYLKLVKSKGNTTEQKDQQALSEAEDSKPDIGLLKARFYFDGGYYDKALAQLSGKEESSFIHVRDRIQLYYYLGRIYDKTGKTAEAISNYQHAIATGKDTRYYFAANAAVAVGRIYESKKDFDHAADFYNQALAMKDHQYQTDIDNDAKAGLKRIGK